MMAVLAMECGRELELVARRPRVISNEGMVRVVDYQHGVLRGQLRLGHEYFSFQLQIIIGESGRADGA